MPISAALTIYVIVHRRPHSAAMVSMPSSPLHPCILTCRADRQQRRNFRNLANQFQDFVAVTEAARQQTAQELAGIYEDHSVLHKKQRKLSREAVRRYFIENPRLTAATNCLSLCIHSNRIRRINPLQPPRINVMNSKPPSKNSRKGMPSRCMKLPVSGLTFDCHSG